MAKENMSNGNGKDKRVLVEVNNLVKYFPVRSGLLQRVNAWVKAVDDVSFFIYEGETFGPCWGVGLWKNDDWSDYSAVNSGNVRNCYF